MEFLLVIGFTVAAIAGGVWYYRAYREARTWTEVHTARGVADKAQAVAICDELKRNGIRVQLKTTGRFEILSPLKAGTPAYIQVHREDFVPATRIVLSLTRG